MARYIPDNIAQFSAVKPLNRMQRPRGKMLHSVSPPMLEDYQARRMYRDLQAFIAARYPEQRNIALATTFLTLGAAYAARSGIDSKEIARFVSQEQDKCV